MTGHIDPLRVALVSEVFLPKVDGVVNTLCHLLRHLAQGGHDALLFTPASGMHEYAGTRIVNLPSHMFPLYPGLRLSTPLADLGPELEDFRPDVVHLVNPVSLGVAGLRHARRLNLPVVASYQTDLPGFAEQWGLGVLSEPIWAYLSWIHNQADLNLCPSRTTWTTLRERSFRRLKIWGRGVDTQLFNPCRRSPARRTSLSAGRPDAPLLLFVGRLSAEKRVDRLRYILDALPNVRLAIVGDGPDRARLEAHFADHPVVFTGFLQGQGLAEAYASADIFVFPSANETFGNTVLEAMASGLPVVAARAGGPIDTVSEGLTGFLYDSDSRNDLVDAVSQLIADPARTRKMAAAAREHACARRWEKVLDDLVQDYCALVAEKRRTNATGKCPGKATIWPKSSCSTPVANHWQS